MADYLKFFKSIVNHVQIIPELESRICYLNFFISGFVSPTSIYYTAGRYINDNSSGLRPSGIIIDIAPIIPKSELYILLFILRTAPPSKTSPAHSGVCKTWMPNTNNACGGCFRNFGQEKILHHDNINYFLNKWLTFVITKWIRDYNMENIPNEQFP